MNPVKRILGDRWSKNKELDEDEDSNGRIKCPDCRKFISKKHYQKHYSNHFRE